MQEVDLGNSTVKYDITYTSNLGNFESVKIGVGLEQECSFAKKNETYDKVREWVEKRLEEAVKDVVSQLKSD